jgi:hypothetical protein
MFILRFLTQNLKLGPVEMFFFYYRNSSYFTADMLRDFILIKMRQKFLHIPIFRVVCRFLNKIRHFNGLRGFKVLLSGRFSRRDRSTFY